MKTTSNNRRARGAPRRRSLIIALAVALIAAVAPSFTANVGAADPAKPVSMRLLVIAADGNETDYPAITTFLDEVGVPYDKILAADTPLTASMLSDGTTGKYQGIVLTTGNLTYFDAGAGTWQSAFSPDEWATLRQYQKDFHVRSVTSYTFPEASYGLSYAGYRNTLGSELPATLTAAGQAVWPYVNAANPIELTGAWVYLGSVIDPNVTTPLVNVTVDKYIQVWRPDYNRKPAYRFLNVRGGKENNVIRYQHHDELRGKYTQVECIGNQLGYEGPQDPNNPNASKKRGSIYHTDLLPFLRRLTFSDGQMYQKGLAQKAAEWRYKREIFGSWYVSYTVEGHHQNGVWYEADQICYIQDDDLGLDGNFYVAAVDYAVSKQDGDTTTLTIRLPGLLTAAFGVLPNAPTVKSLRPSTINGKTQETRP